MPGAQIKKAPCITDYSFSGIVWKFSIQHLPQPNNFFGVYSKSKNKAASLLGFLLFFLNSHFWN